MKRLFPKARLEWKEPKCIRRANEAIEKQPLSPWTKPGIVAIMAGLILTNWWFARYNPNKHPPSLPGALALAVLGGCFFTYVLPCMYRFCPSQVRVYDHGISRVIGNSAALWKYKDIERCELALLASSQGAHSILVIHLRNSKRIIIGMNTDLVSQLIHTLSQLNVCVEVPSDQRGG